MVLPSHSTPKITVLLIDKVCTKITKTLTGTNIIALCFVFSLSTAHDKVKKLLGKWHCATLFPLDNNSKAWTNGAQ